MKKIYIFILLLISSPCLGLEALSERDMGTRSASLESNFGDLPLPKVSPFFDNDNFRAVIVGVDMPAEIVNQGISGHVNIEFYVDSSGKVINAKVVSSNPQGMYEKYAIDSISRWLVLPKSGRLKGTSGPYVQEFKFRFNPAKDSLGPE